MARVLVTGGTGSLGSAVVAKLKTTDHQVRLLSRKLASEASEESMEWVQGDIVTGVGLADALTDVDIIVNCVGNPLNVYETDVLGVKRLAETANQHGIKHFFHISIVGIDLIDYAYYRHKLSAEAAIRESGVPFSILRVTQFHSLLNYLMSKLAESSDGYVLPTINDALFQLIDTRDVAEYILPLLLKNPEGLLRDVGGPEVLRIENIARIFLTARGVENPKFVNPSKDFFPLATVEAFQQGRNTAPNNRFGQISWADYVHENININGLSL